jgi:hypothetical protein
MLPAPPLNGAVNEFDPVALTTKSSPVIAAVLCIQIDLILSKLSVIEPPTIDWDTLFKSNKKHVDGLISADCMLYTAFI